MTTESRTNQHRNCQCHQVPWSANLERLPLEKLRSISPTINLVPLHSSEPTETKKRKRTKTISYIPDPPQTAKMSPSATNGHGANGASSKVTPLSWDTFSNTINGKADNGKNTRHGINPATEENSSTVPVATQDDVDRAMVAAQKAFKTWAAVPYAERQKAVRAFADALEAEKDGFSKLLTKEQGKPVKRLFSQVLYYCASC